MVENENQLSEKGKLIQTKWLKKYLIKMGISFCNLGISFYIMNGYIIPLKMGIS